MADSWLSDVGIRVTNLERSLAFYTTILDLEELKRASDDDSAYVLLRDRRSGQRLELNWYAESNPFYAPYVPGEGLDHLEVRVRSLPEFLDRIRAKGIVPSTRKLWVNEPVVAKARQDPTLSRWVDQDVWVTSNGHRIAYLEDPDGNFVCAYDHPEEEWEGPIPDHY